MIAKMLLATVAHFSQALTLWCAFGFGLMNGRHYYLDVTSTVSNVSLPVSAKRQCVI